MIDFYVDFEFRSRMLQKLIGLLFNEAVSRMVRAVGTRARQFYGDRAARPMPQHLAARRRRGHNRAAPRQLPSSRLNRLEAASFTNQ